MRERSIGKLDLKVVEQVVVYLCFRSGEARPQVTALIGIQVY